jgi:hypothetical protein
MNNKLNIDLNNVDNVICEECEGDTFSPSFIIKQLSALMSPSGKETLIPLQIFKCDKCGHINELFLKGLTN